jgi:hypothetical protein
MKNLEKYESAVKDYGIYFGLDKNTRELFECCTKDDCEKCSFMNHNCHNKKMEWLYQEYREPIKLKKVEFEFLKYIYKLGFLYISKDSYGALEIHIDKPIETEKGYFVSDDCCDFNQFTYFGLFEFVKSKNLINIENLLSSGIVEEVEDD